MEADSHGRDRRGVPPNARESIDILLARNNADLAIQHDDLIQLLYKLATGAGARVDLNAAVAAIHPGTDAQPNPKVVLTSGEILYANIIIGADGSQSMVREVVLGEPDRPKPGGLTVYVGVVKAEDILQDPELERTLHVDEVRCGLVTGITSQSITSHSAAVDNVDVTTSVLQWYVNLYDQGKRRSLIVPRRTLRRTSDKRL